MEGFQTPRQDQSRLSDLANRKSKDSRLKKKVVKRNLDTSVPENLLTDTVKEPADFSQISDADESFALASLEPLDVISLEREVVANLLKQAQNQVSNSNDIEARSKRLLDALVKIIVEELYTVPEEKDRFNELVLAKIRIVLLLFLIWIIVMSVVLFFNSGAGGSFSGSPPT
ncbi:protein SINE3-like [Pistacia vera]|uniref:protein SINE3-like n=1 Tax=Pistacia vera TaxID=55513 RepID=UPI001263CE1F|nr:protein SINE3-like [Pistacia vera]